MSNDFPQNTSGPSNAAIHEMAEVIVNELVTAFGKSDPNPALQVLADSAALIMASAPADQLEAVLDDFKSAVTVLIAGYRRKLVVGPDGKAPRGN